MPALRADPLRLLILGLGNVLLEDDGVGAIAAEWLRRRYDPPPGVEIVDGGTRGLSLLPLIEDAECALLLDAVRASDPPGTLVRIRGDEVEPAIRERLSPHQIGVADLLDGARWQDRMPRQLLLLGLVPERLELGVGLSPAVAERLPELVQLAAEEAAALGFPLRPRRADAPPPTLDRDALAGVYGV